MNARRVVDGIGGIACNPQPRSLERESSSGSIRATSRGCRYRRRISLTFGALRQHNGRVSRAQRNAVNAESERQTSALGPANVLDAYRQELDYLCRTLKRLGVHEADIEDMAHEVFLLLCRRWDDYDRRRPIRPYLFGVAFRVAATHRRRRRREVPWKGADVPDPSLSAEQLMWSDQARSLVLRALEEIPLPRRAVFIMRELDESPMTTVAEVLGIPTFTAYSRLRKARTEFKRAVKRLQETPYP